MLDDKSLYDSVQLGALTLSNRVFMAPLTRNRANANGVPGPLASTYYEQRASAGLIITEATQISPIGKGYINTPGIHSPQQVSGWREIVDAVHIKGGHIFLQLWHVGRISHRSLLPGNVPPVAPSAIRANSSTFITSGVTQVSEPVALTLEGISLTLADYRQAALNARQAAFDGVEIHAANGYLIDQFLRSRTNQRSDLYGGSATNRVRFLAEVVERVLEVWEPSRVGVRLSPIGTFNDMADDNPEETFGAAIEQLRSCGIGYLHMVEASEANGASDDAERKLLRSLRAHWNGFFIANGDYDGERAEEAVRSGYADAVAFGRAFLANPDLPRRLRLRRPLNPLDPQTFYGGDSRGYTDYPFLTDRS
jgi:N-ethylmaleimide reductase